jgi:hypothetical protein
MFTNPSSIKEHRVLLSHSFLNLNRNGSPGIHSSNLNLFWKDPRALGSNLLSLTLPGGCNRTTSSDGMNLSLIFFSVSPREGNSWFKSNWGWFLYSNSITIRYKLFYWSRHVCPVSRAAPGFLFSNRKRIGDEIRLSQQGNRSRAGNQRCFASKVEYSLFFLRISVIY